MTQHWPERIISFWFEEMKPEDWWTRNEAVDQQIRERFQPLWLSEQKRPARDFLASARCALGAIILFDQFPRNMFRDSAQAYSTDLLAQNITSGAVEAELDQQLAKEQRPFVYMPFMHAEDLALQEKSLTLFDALGSNQKFAADHHAVIAEFGRFPHRNAVLNRQSTEAELNAVANGAAW